jgi:SAM-dependent methyltransferase
MTRAAFDVIAGVLDGIAGRPQPPTRLALRSVEGVELPLEVGRWMGIPDVHEERALALAIAPVLDVGCGPARHTIALLRRGVGALGLDESPAIVGLATRRGASVLQGSVFDPVPGQGLWGSVLLLDGNIGIGGDPYRLLRRVRALLRPGGRALAELDSTDSTLHRLLVHVTGIPVGAPEERFAWATVGPRAMSSLARAAGFHRPELWRDGRRWFASLDAV